MRDGWSAGSKEGALALMPGDVRAYLLDHPDFLADNDDILGTLIPPSCVHGVDKVEDFQRYMLVRLQDHFMAIKGEHDDLLDLMQEQMQRQNRLAGAVLSLMDAPDFPSFLEAASSDLALQMDHEASALFLEAPQGLETGAYGALTLVPVGFIEDLMKGRELILEEKKEEARALYGDKDDEVRSQALLRLSFSNLLPPALLALGHADPFYYATGLATEQIEFLGAMIERCFNKWLRI